MTEWVREGQHRDSERDILGHSYKRHGEEDEEWSKEPIHQHQQQSAIVTSNVPEDRDEEIATRITVNGGPSQVSGQVLLCTVILVSSREPHPLLLFGSAAATIIPCTIHAKPVLLLLLWLLLLTWGGLTHHIYKDTKGCFIVRCGCWGAFFEREKWILIFLPSSSTSTARLFDSERRQKIRYFQQESKTYWSCFKLLCWISIWSN